jgi:hypothetical protein
MTAMARNLVFDAGQYDAIIRELTDLAGNLTTATTTGDTPLTDQVLLQPDGQKWLVASSLVAAGKSFFADKDDLVNNLLLPQLAKLSEGMAGAKSVFQEADDLSQITATEFDTEFPALAAPLPTGQGS